VHGFLFGFQAFGAVPVFGFVDDPVLRVSIDQVKERWSRGLLPVERYLLRQWARASELL